MYVSKRIKIMLWSGCDTEIPLANSIETISCVSRSSYSREHIFDIPHCCDYARDFCLIDNGNKPTLDLSNLVKSYGLVIDDKIVCTYHPSKSPHIGLCNIDILGGKPLMLRYLTDREVRIHVEFYDSIETSNVLLCFGACRCDKDTQFPEKCIQRFKHHKIIQKQVSTNERNRLDLDCTGCVEKITLYMSDELDNNVSSIQMTISGMNLYDPHIRPEMLKLMRSTPNHEIMIGVDWIGLDFDKHENKVLSIEFEKGEYKDNNPMITLVIQCINVIIYEDQPHFLKRYLDEHCRR
jgi:hypothetical protein